MPGADEGVQDEVALVCVQLDQASWKLEGKRCRMPDPGGARRGHLPHIDGGVEELVGLDRGLVGETALFPKRPFDGTVEPPLGGDDHPLRDVAQDGVVRRAE